MWRLNECNHPFPSNFPKGDLPFSGVLASTFSVWGFTASSLFRLMRVVLCREFHGEFISWGWWMESSQALMCCFVVTTPSSSLPWILFSLVSWSTANSNLQLLSVRYMQSLMSHVAHDDTPTVEWTVAVFIQRGVVPELSAKVVEAAYSDETIHLKSLSSYNESCDAWWYPHRLVDSSCIYTAGTGARA